MPRVGLASRLTSRGSQAALTMARRRPAGMVEQEPLSGVRGRDQLVMGANHHAHGPSFPTGSRRFSRLEEATAGRYSNGSVGLPTPQSTMIPLPSQSQSKREE